MKKWNREPTVKRVFFDNFSKGIRKEVWRALNEKWSSQNNNGYSEDNCFYTTDQKAVAAEGASGGLVIIRSNGDFASEASKKRQGGGIVTKELFGPGLYETRIKVVPRAGQCSAMWTYYNNWAPTAETRKYSEIDIELPHGGDYRFYSGTVYENYIDGENKISRSEVINGGAPLNDGKWHTLAFEWRTDKANGDEGVIWYQDGRQVLCITEAVPHYTATFWVASLFQDAIAWLGDPQFETAYMYVDWVKITEYTDPVEDGCAEKESKLLYTGIDLKSNPVPKNDYISNAYFSRPAVEQNFKGRKICSWEIAGGEIERGALRLKGGRASQIIAAQYCGFSFEADVCGTSDGELRIFLEYLSGKANTENPKFEVLGKSRTYVLKPGEKAVKAIWKIDEEKTEHLRFVIEAEGTAVVEEAHLYLI